MQTSPQLPNTSNSSQRGKALMLANPNAGGKKELARLLERRDSLELEIRVTRSKSQAADILGRDVSADDLIILWGGDGTLQSTLDQLAGRAGLQRLPDEPLPRVATVGGGTMNVISRWCGFSSSAEKNVRHLLRAYRDRELRYRPTQLLRVSQGERVRHGFIFGMGPMIRVVQAFDARTDKSIPAALSYLARAIGAVFWPGVFRGLAQQVQPLQAQIAQDGAALPFDEYGVLFASTTDRIFHGAQPFVAPAGAHELSFLAYADSTRAISATFPLLARGWRPRSRHQGGAAEGTDAERYVNDSARQLVVQSAEPIFTLDGEIFPSTGEPLTIEAGPFVALAQGPSRAPASGRRLLPRAAEAAA